MLGTRLTVVYGNQVTYFRDDQPMQRGLICVYYAADMGEADIVAAWLDDQGIAVYVKDRNTGSLAPLTVAPLGVEVCVIDPAKADQAKSLVREHLQLRKEKMNAPAVSPFIDAICEECGKSSRFPFEHRGTVQTCPHCKRYLDVPEA